MKMFRVLFLLSLFLVALSSLVCAEEKWVITYTEDQGVGHIKEYAVDVNNYRTIKDGGYIYYEKFVDYDQDYTEQYIIFYKYVIRRAEHTAIVTQKEVYWRHPMSGKIERMENRVTVANSTPKKVNYEEKGYENIRAAIQFLDELEAEK